MLQPAPQCLHVSLWSYGGGKNVSNGFLNMDDSSLWKPLFAILLALNNSPVKLEAREALLSNFWLCCSRLSQHNPLICLLNVGVNCTHTNTWVEAFVQLLHSAVFCDRRTWKILEGKCYSKRQSLLSTCQFSNVSKSLLPQQETQVFRPIKPFLSFFCTFSPSFQEKQVNSVVETQNDDVLKASQFIFAFFFLFWHCY